MPGLWNKWIGSVSLALLALSAVNLLAAPPEGLSDRLAMARSLSPAVRPIREESAEKMKEASLSYFQSVGELLKDLKRQGKRSGSTYTTGSMSMWYDKFARKIDDLPMLSVDPYLLDYGATTSATLRQASDVLKTGGTRSKTAQLNAPKVYDSYTYTDVYGYTFHSGPYSVGVIPWGYSDTYYQVNERETNANRARIRMNHRNESIRSARSLIDSIDSSTASIRRQMTQKYQVEFE